MQLHSTQSSQAKNTIPYSSAAMRQDLGRLRGAWDDCQASHGRNAIYDYLNAVYALVTWWAAEGREIDRARRALRLQRLEVSGRDDPFAAVIRCTAAPGKADKRTRKREPPAPPRRKTDRPRQSTGAPGPGAEVYVDAWHFPPIGETMSMEPAEELLADRRPIDNRHPPNRRARWRVLPTAASPGRTPVDCVWRPRPMSRSLAEAISDLDDVDNAEPGS
jgi:hypothetical protein